jgi:hypothetical protein
MIKLPCFLPKELFNKPNNFINKNNFVTYQMATTLLNDSSGEWCATIIFTIIAII